MTDSTLQSDGNSQGAVRSFAPFLFVLFYFAWKSIQTVVFECEAAAVV
jgi:hypothetical protein